MSIIVCVWNQEELVIRALDSIPERDDIEVIVVDDGSTDNSLRAVTEYAESRRKPHIRVFSMGEDVGVGLTRNRGMDLATGEYVHHLDSDDYLITEMYEKAMECLDGSDIVYIDLEINDGTVFRLNPDTKRIWCAFTTKFVRRKFIGDLRCPPKRHAEDWYFNEELQKKNPSEVFTHITAYHYNHPRKGSLCEEMSNGLRD